MLPQVTINYLAVVVAALVSMVVGFVWYSFLFGKAWMKAVNITQKGLASGRKEANKYYLIMAVASLVSAYVLAHFADYVGASTVGEGLALGFWVWLGFVAATSLGDYLFSGRPKNLYLINNGSLLVSMLAMAVILAIWV